MPCILAKYYIISSSPLHFPVWNVFLLWGRSTTMAKKPSLLYLTYNLGRWIHAFSKSICLKPNTAANLWIWTQLPDSMFHPIVSWPIQALNNRFNKKKILITYQLYQHMSAPMHFHRCWKFSAYSRIPKHLLCLVIWLDFEKLGPMTFNLHYFCIKIKRQVLFKKKNARY